MHCLPLDDLNHLNGRVSALGMHSICWAVTANLQGQHNTCNSFRCGLDSRYSSHRSIQSRSLDRSRNPSSTMRFTRGQVFIKQGCYAAPWQALGHTTFAIPVTAIHEACPTYPLVRLLFPLTSSPDCKSCPPQTDRSTWTHVIPNRTPLLATWHVSGPVGRPPNPTCRWIS